MCINSLPYTNNHSIADVQVSDIASSSDEWPQVVGLAVDFHFRKKMNKGPLLYIHLNLSIALLLALLVFVGGIESAKMIKVL